MNLAKIPPHNDEAEQSVLGSLLIDQEAIVRVAEKISPEDFYQSRHRDIFQAIIDLYEKREPADVVTVAGNLTDCKKMDSVGGEAYLAELVSRVPTAAHVESYAQIVKDCSIRRSLITMSAGLAEKSFDGQFPVPELLNEAEKHVFSLSQEHLTRYFVPIKETLVDCFDQLEELHRNKGQYRGIPTGFRSIDNMLAGLQDGSLIILAARPSVGKTSLALNIAQYVSVHEKLPVAFFSLESSRDELSYRLLSSQADIDAWKITTGNLSDDDFRKIGDAFGVLGDAQIFIDDTPGMSVSEMRTKARRLQLEHGVRLIIVDYLQLAISRNLENRVQEVSEISQGMKNLAREIKCPVIALSQLSRAVEVRGSNRPQLSDLRDSGSIEQDADVVMFLYRADQEDQENQDKKSSADKHIKLLISKHRNGSTGEVDMVFKGSRTRFYCMEKSKEVKKES